jgi:hypothetical protein
VCEADVVRVLTERSLVVPAEAWEPERERQFRVVLTGVPMPRTTVAVTGDAVTAGALVTAMGTHGPGGGPSAHVRPAAVDEHADLTVEVAAGSLWITDGTGERLADGPPDIRGTVDTLEHLARWRQIRDLGNPLSGLKNPIDIEIVPAVPGVTEAPKTGGALRPEDDGAYHLRYEGDGSGWAAPEIFVRLHNTGSAELYCVLLDLTGRFGVHAALFPGAPIGPGMRGAAMRGRRIRVSLPDGVVPEPGRRVTDWLVLVVAEKQFSEEPFLLPPLGGKVRAGTRNIAFHGLLERLGERAMLRDFGAADADAAYDWNTRTVRVVTDVPE